MKAAKAKAKAKAAKPKGAKHWPRSPSGVLNAAFREAGVALTYRHALDATGQITIVDIGAVHGVDASDDISQIHSAIDDIGAVHSVIAYIEARLLKCPLGVAQKVGRYVTNPGALAPILVMASTNNLSRGLILSDIARARVWLIKRWRKLYARRRETRKVGRPSHDARDQLIVHLLERRRRPKQSMAAAIRELLAAEPVWGHGLAEPAKTIERRWRELRLRGRK